MEKTIWNIVVILADKSWTILFVSCRRRESIFADARRDGCKKDAEKRLRERPVTQRGEGGGEKRHGEEDGGGRRGRKMREEGETGEGGRDKGSDNRRDTLTPPLPAKNQHLKKKTNIFATQMIQNS